MSRTRRDAFLDLLAAALAAKGCAEDGDTQGAGERLRETADRARALADWLDPTDEEVTLNVPR